MQVSCRGHCTVGDGPGSLGRGQADELLHGPLDDRPRAQPAELGRVEEVCAGHAGLAAVHPHIVCLRSGGDGGFNGEETGGLCTVGHKRCHRKPQQQLRAALRASAERTVGIYHVCMCWSARRFLMQGDVAGLSSLPYTSLKPPMGPRLILTCSWWAYTRHTIWLISLQLP